MKTATKPVKLGALIKEADKWVSLFVRLNAADQNGTVTCVSCPERLWWSDADTAHFKDRDNMATRYYLPNLAPACPNCNRYRHFNHIATWTLRMPVAQYSDLERRSHSLMKFTRPELEDLISDFKAKVESMKKTKGL
jgi:hypothetical protein